MNDTKEHITDVTRNVKNAFSLNDNLNLDKIIEDEFEKAFEILNKLGYNRRYKKNIWNKPYKTEIKNIGR
jgi:hypothetical protein